MVCRRMNLLLLRLLLVLLQHGGSLKEVSIGEGDSLKEVTSHTTQHYSHATKTLNPFTIKP